MNVGATPLIAARGVVKRFGSLTALEGVDFSLHPGEVHALVGENGAGKSTLMRILYGLLAPDAGDVIRSDGAAVGMVFQHYQLIERFTVAENVMLGRERTRGGLLDEAAMNDEVRATAARYGFDVDPRERVDRLGVGARQRVELLKALEREANVVIFDEPTAALSPDEAQSLFQVIARFKREGRAVAFVSHKLREVLDVADRITILRRGRVAGATKARDADVSTLAEMMIGRRLAAATQPRHAASTAAPVLQTRGLVAVRDDGAPAFADVNLAARAGEIVGIAGVEGNGQFEFAECVYGLRRARAGKITFDGTDVTLVPPTARRRAGMRYVPPDAGLEGLVGDFTPAENVLLGDQRAQPGMGLDLSGAHERAEALSTEYALRGYAPTARVGTFSGGTQQKLVVGRELAQGARLVIAFLPTRGVDIGAAETIHRRLREVRDAGAAVLLISYDLDEIRMLSDRVIVFAGGCIAGELPPDASDREIGKLMGGVTADA